MYLARQVAEKLLEIEAVQFRPTEPFIWASGLKSPIYCDNRLILSHPEVRELIKSGLINKSNQLKPIEYVAGVATAGIAFGMMLADSLGLPYVYVRSKPKNHGRQNQIEGKIINSAHTLVIEDLISTGGSSINAVDALRLAGAQVSHVLTIFSYGLKVADTNFMQSNCHYHSLCNYDTIIDVAQERNYILSHQMDSLKSWRQNPTKWSKEH